MMRQSFAILLIQICTLFSAFGQDNLVPNGSFEKFSDCPSTYGDLIRCNNWLKTSSGNTPDYFNRCHRPDKNGKILFGVPYNFEGKREPNFGEAYIGMGLFFNTNFYYREYIQTELTEPLINGHVYKVSMYICLTDSAEYFTDHISFNFSKERTLDFAKSPYELLKSKHAVTYRQKDSFKSKTWTKIEIEYTAKGNEKFLTIGSFAGDMSEKEFIRKVAENLNPSMQCRDKECAAYYYIDDIAVEEVLDKRKLNSKF